MIRKLIALDSDSSTTKDKMLRPVKKLFLVPVGLPGMGKSTLAKNFKAAIEKHNSSMKVESS